MYQKLVYLVSFLALTLGVSSSHAAIEEIAGGADHPELPRIAGSSLVAHLTTEYGEHDFLVSYNNDGKTISAKNTDVDTKEGKLTRLVYALEPTQTSLFALRNYQEAFADIGEVKEIFTCKNANCPRDIGSRFVWPRDKRFEASVGAINHMYAVGSYRKGSLYWSAQVESEQSNYTCLLYTSPSPRDATLSRMPSSA